MTLMYECVVGRLRTGESPGPGAVGEATGGAREAQAEGAGKLAAEIQEGETEQVPRQLEGETVVAVRPGGHYFRCHVSCMVCPRGNKCIFETMLYFTWLVKNQL